MSEHPGGHMTPEQFRRYGHAVVDWIADYQEQVGSYPVLSPVQPGQIRAALPPHPPAEGEPFEAVTASDQATRDRAGEILYRFVFRSLYRLRAFNGDPHPGNYLFAPDGTRVAQDDAIIRGDEGLGGGWPAGALVRDEHLVTLPAELAPGEYSLLVALYETGSGAGRGAVTVGGLRVP